MDYVEAVDKFKAAYMVTALWTHLGNVSKTAEALGITRRTIQLSVSASRINVPKIRKESNALYEEGITELEDPSRYFRRGKK